MTNGCVVNQTHWDREWYFTNADALVLSEDIFSDILEELEQHPEANFCLDAQSSILDEYLEICPENVDRVKRLVEKQQLFIGPWFTQSDCLLVDGESLLRNAMIGVRDCKKYGEYMPIGYLPDTFGFNAQLPTLLRQIGLDNVIFWRGIDFTKQVSTPYFRWKGLGEKEVFAINIPQGYGCSPNLKTNQEYIDTRLDGYLDFVNQFQEQEAILVPAGGDQQAVVRDLEEKLEEINTKSKHQYQISSFPEFLSLVKQQVDLPVYEGEFRLPAYARIHRTISSVRMDIKQVNYELEQKLIKRLEPLYVLAGRYEINISKELLIKTWKRVLASQAHDSLGGCVYDNVAEDILHRYKEANELVDGIENVILKKMARKLDLAENEVLLINTQGRAREKFYKIKVLTETKKIKFAGIDEAYIVSEKKTMSRENILIEKPEGKFYLTEPEYFELEIMVKTRVKGLGYKVISFEASEEELPTWVVTDKGNELKIAEKDFALSFENGHIQAYYNNQLIPDFVQLMDCGNDGDTYDFSPLRGDVEIALPFHYGEKQVVGNLKKLIVYGAAALPVDLADRQNSAGRYKEVTYSLTLTLDAEKRSVDGKLEVDNCVLSHRMRLVFDPQLANSDTYAGVTTGFLKNNQVDLTNTESYPEYPAPLNVFDKVVALADSDKQFIFYGQGLKEYEVRDNKLYLTLFTSTGQFGKPDLLWRSGRASGDTTNQGHVMHQTPLAQLLGQRVFDFHFELTAGVFNEKAAFAELDRLSEQAISYQAQQLNHFVYRLDNKIQERSEVPLLLEEDGGLELGELLLQAVYPSYYEKGKYLLRLANPTGETVKVDVGLFNKPVIVTALEESAAQVFELAPYDLLTIKVDY
ncbi:alpha-mannosidase [Enterococcus raffinosus]|uniref:glycoside hydrolase family 38 N-terminal domain-containing protein n=1 Tax=Enterococcus raffinosus TaxID=71452 RepID=UPI001C120B85|nr:alpha-mannosidase [Enterococcus raffinosus]MBU5363399.1 alpha-mannosidase [Enterococcus raffinosus]